MILKSISVENFRNIEYAELEFAPGVNILCGKNAQGKTNLLEAISICIGRSFRNIRRGDIIPFNFTDSLTKIKLEYVYESLPDKINTVLYEATRSEYSIQINGIGSKKASELYGDYKYVVFVPDNLNIIKGYPDGRRSYLDNIAIMQNKAHRTFLSEYNSALKQRCNAYFQGATLVLLEVWNDILIKQGINLTYGRLKYLEMICQYACEIYKELSGGEILRIAYKSNPFAAVFTENLNFENKAELYDAYKEKLLLADARGNLTSSADVPGAHKDDILFNIDGKDARTYASQGQLRSIAVSLKLAEAQIIRNFNRENPVVLLDEVLGELDEYRREFVLKQYDDSQCFITSCNVHDFEKLANMRVWSVDNGLFTPRQ